MREEHVPASAPAGDVAVDRDLVCSAVGAIIYSFALGIATVILPLLALHVGFSKSTVGYLIACSAISQMTCRLVLGAVMRRYSDWILIFGAGAFLSVSCAMVAISAALVPFVLAELLQGLARACFWTGSQTHVVRGRGSSVRRLAWLNFLSSFGILAGPLAGGFIGNWSLSGALYVAAGVAIIGMIPPALLDRLPPFAAVGQGGGNSVWRRPGVDIGCMAGVSAGTWRGMLSSYVPVVLQGAGQSAQAIGALIGVANAASMAGAALVGRIGHSRLAASFAIATIATGLGTAAIGIAATVTPLEVVVLGLSGVGAGALQTLGPAIALDAVEPAERGDVIAITGTYRAGALFLAPLGVGASLALIPLTAAVTVAGGVVALPALLHRRARRSQRPVPISAVVSSE